MTGIPEPYPFEHGIITYYKKNDGYIYANVFLITGKGRYLRLALTEKINEEEERSIYELIQKAKHEQSKDYDMRFA